MKMKSVRDSLSPRFMAQLEEKRAEVAHVAGPGREHPLEREEPNACPRCNGAGVVYNMDLPFPHCWTIRNPADNSIAAAARCDCTMEKRKGELFSESEVPPRFSGYTLDTYPWDMTQSAVFDAIHEWDGQNPPFLLLWGDVGRGKTGLAVGLLRAETDRLRRGKFVSVTDLLVRLRDTARADAPLSYSAVLDAVRQAPFLVLDDIGKERVTSSGFTEESIFQIVDYRYNWRLPTVYTSNMSVGDLATHLGMPTVSRITGGSLVLEVTGSNLRSRKPESPKPARAKDAAA